MPTYQYVCSACDEPLEVVQAFTDDALTTCPACGAQALRKVYGSVGVVFKGSGFYRNDARATSASTGDSAASSPAPAASSGTSSSGTASAPSGATSPAVGDSTSSASSAPKPSSTSASSSSTPA